MSTIADVRDMIRALNLEELLDIAGAVLYEIGVRARDDRDQLRALQRVLRKHGIDPTSPTAANDLELRLSGKDTR